MMKERVFLSTPDIGKSEEAAVLRAIRSGWVAPLGPEVDLFESEVAARVGRRFGVALNSGTAALHLALLGVGASRGDVVITSTMTFAATANAIVYTGAEPFFVDCSVETGNMKPELLQAAIELVRNSGRRVAAIVPVDLLGKVAEYGRILPIAERAGIPVVSDAAESLGARSPTGPAGSHGTVAAVSFNGNKIMTTSGGGMLVTDDVKLADRTRYLAQQARQPVVHYEHTEVGFNYRLSNVLAALGRAQLSRLDEMIGRRRELRDRYRGLFASVDGVELFGAVGDEHDNCWLTSIVVDSDVTGWTTADLSTTLMAHNIESRPLWKPMHLQPVFATSGRLVDGTAQGLFETGLTLPSGSNLAESDTDAVFSALTGFLER